MCSPLHHRLSKRMESGATNEFHVVPPFLNVPPVCLEPWLQVADAAEPLKRKVKPAVRRECPRALLILPLTLDSGGLASENSHKWLCARSRAVPPAHRHQAQLKGPLGARGRGAPGGGSKLVIGHLQELRIHVPDALSLGVEQELVVAAVRTDRNDSVWLCPKGTNAWRA